VPRPIALPPAVLEASPATPLAATPVRGKAARVLRKPQPPANDKPLQVRLPRAEVKAIKLAAAEREQTISNFMLACFHAYIKAEKKA